MNDQVVAGGPEDFAEVRHLRLAGTNQEIGRTLAEIAHQRHRAGPSALRPVLVRARRAWYERNYPIHYQRMAGVAQAMAVALDDDRLDCAALGGEPGPGGCSVAYFPGSHTAEGGAFLSRNYDFTTAKLTEMLDRPPAQGELPMSARPYVIECYPDRGYPSLYLTYSYA
ncbi:MAG: peptidase C45, acyl-coenzyme A - 6-aminopenicillanic acid acyl-transferase, partial [Actinomycetota bacterium]|nr:peptidase C45, acyl-coenzyme A - 6-aminopenicillanic acid acyl-transferase [Actinomycetota bacterium]